jgi:hypothetical protein
MEKEVLVVEVLTIVRQDQELQDKEIQEVLDYLIVDLE